jgi:hypothetical protein
MSKGTCKHEECKGDAVGKGYCKRHYGMWKRGQLAKARYKTCTAENCRKPRAIGSKCAEHGAKAPAAAAAAPAAAPAPAAPADAAPAETTDAG